MPNIQALPVCPKCQKPVEFLSLEKQTITTGLMNPSGEIEEHPIPECENDCFACPSCEAVLFEGQSLAEAFFHSAVKQPSNAR
jgi:hypothetical protein